MRKNKSEDGGPPENRLDGTGSPPKPHVSMTESDKPDMMDLVSYSPQYTSRSISFCTIACSY